MTSYNIRPHSLKSKICSSFSHLVTSKLHFASFSAQKLASHLSFPLSYLLFALLSTFFSAGFASSILLHPHIFLPGDLGAGSTDLSTTRTQSYETGKCKPSGPRGPIQVHSPGPLGRLAFIFRLFSWPLLNIT